MARRANPSPDLRSSSKKTEPPVFRHVRFKIPTWHGIKSSQLIFRIASSQQVFALNTRNELNFYKRRIIFPQITFSNIPFSNLSGEGSVKIFTFRLIFWKRFEILGVDYWKSYRTF